jgi:hypothetical protein
MNRLPLPVFSGGSPCKAWPNGGYGNLQLGDDKAMGKRHSVICCYEDPRLHGVQLRQFM